MEFEIKITGKGTPRELSSTLTILAGMIRGQEAVTSLGEESVDDLNGETVNFWNKPILNIKIMHKDKTGTNIEKFDEVYVPEPSVDDLHNFEFTGMVDGFRNGYAVVSDQDGNTFEIEPNRLIKV